MILEDWIRMIFIDKTTIQLRGVRSKKKVWSKSYKTYYFYCIKRK
jgi:hypothetical protein